MNNEYIFESERLGFRLWRKEDKVPFSRMNADINVMKYFSSVLTKKESNEFVDKIKGHFKLYGYGLWVVEIKATREFVGFIGFYTATFKAHFTPCVEIGWRLDSRYWHKGYATEGALKCLEYGFNILGFNSVFSFTSKLNQPSINVMKKIGLIEVGSFIHPKINKDNSLSEHVLYKIDRLTYENIKKKES